MTPTGLTPSGSELLLRPGWVSTRMTCVSRPKRTSLTGTRVMFRYVRIALEQRRGEVLQRRRAGERVRIGVVVRQDDERPGMIERLQEARQGAAIRGYGHRAVRIRL